VEETSTVIVGVCAAALLLVKLSEDEVKVHVGSVALVAPEGPLVTGQLNVTVPVKELPGVTAMVEVPLWPWATVMLVGLAVSVKLVALLVLGACQKSPQPATNAAAANNPAQDPILIAAPLAPLSGRAVLLILLTG
jgi:uncharacterized membrane protein